MKGLELFGRFWLSTRKARPRIALQYLTEAILKYERWGATEKARLLSDECARLTRNDPTTTLYSMESPPHKVEREGRARERELYIKKIYAENLYLCFLIGFGNDRSSFPDDLQ
jgi:hypothetical protein